MNELSFSFLVACFNDQRYIEQCLMSLVHQRYDHRFYEVVCVDDGSTDGSSRIIEQIAAKHPVVRAFRTPNRGLEKTCNFSITKARYEYLARTDADDFLDLDYLRIMSEAIKNQPQLDFYYCKKYTEYFSEEKQRSKVLPEFDPQEIFARGDFFATGTVYRRSALEEIGNFHDDVKNCGLENYGVILELISRGHQGLAVPQATFYYRRHDNNMSTVHRESIMDYGRRLLSRYNRPFQFNSNHPYLAG